LPDASGIDLCDQIHRLDPKRPIIFCSALPHEFTLPKVLAAGADVYLPKPLSIQRLISTVADLLTRRTKSNAITLSEIENSIEV
jgi:DNA-binding response OmpR family regulator